MSIWQFNASVAGFVKANSASDPKKFSSEEERDSMFEWLLSKDISTDLNLTNCIYIWDGINFNLERIVNFKIKE